MSLTYNLNIPDAPNNPSADQPLMQTNTNSINTLVGVDHYQFASATYGQHKQVTLAGKNAAGVQTDPSSVIYSASGTASTVANVVFRNQNGIFPLNCDRAWASFAGTGANGVKVAIQSVNVTTINKVSTGTYTITPTANSVIGTSLAVFLTTSVSGTSSSISAVYSVSAGPVINIETRAPATGALVDCNLISVMILQI